MTDAIKDLVKIKVIGVGGGGGNAINDMLYSGVTGVEYIAANTDKQDLEKSLADVKLQIGDQKLEDKQPKKILKKYKNF